MNEVVASDAPIATSGIIEKCRNHFEQSKGIGNAFPHLELTVLDLHHVVCSLEGTRNLKFLAGDMFKFIPPASVILL